MLTSKRRTQAILVVAGLWATFVSAGTVGMPFLINPEVSVSDLPSDQWDHRAASDGNIWLVVWADAWSFEIHGVRLDAQGRLLDRVALPIAPNSVGASATERRYPVVAWYQDAFWVVWQEYRGSGLREGYGRRVAADGTFVDASPFRVETSTSSAYRSAVCPGASNLLLTWSTYSSGYRLWAQTYSPDGEPTGVATQLFAGLSSYVQPNMAFGAFPSGEKSYLVTVAQSNDIRGVRVAESGVVLDPAPLPICTFAGSQSSPWPAFGMGPGGTQGWWVAWVDPRSGNSDLYGAFVAQDGTVSHSSTGMMLIAGEDDQANPSLCANGSGYLLGWWDARTPPAVRASVMDQDGGFADTNGTLVSTNEQYTPITCARTAGSFLAVHGYDSVFTETIAASGSSLSVGTQRLVSVAGAYERYNSGGCDGTNYWTAFEYHQSEVDRLGDIAVQRVSSEGVPLFPSPVLVCTNSGDQWGPAAAVAKDAVLVVWTDERNTRDQVWGQRLTLDGQLAGTNLQIGVSALYAYFCDVASDGTNFLVVWADADSGRTRGRFIQASGTMGSVFDVGGSDISDPFVTFGGGYYLVLCADDAAIRFRRYRSDGSAVDTSMSNLYSATSSRWEPLAAYNPDNGRFLVTWRDQATYQIMGRTLDASTAAAGNVITALVVATWGASENCAVAHDGADWLCLFRDVRGDLNALYGARVDSSAALLDSPPFTFLCDGHFGELIPPVSPCTNVLILGTKQVYTVGYTSYNTRKSLGCFWQPGSQAIPGREIEEQGLDLGSSGQRILSFRQSMTASTGYVVEASSSLVAQDWQAITNSSFLDSGVSVSASWTEPGDTNVQRIYRIIGR